MLKDQWRDLLEGSNENLLMMLQGALCAGQIRVTFFNAMLPVLEREFEREFGSQATIMNALRELEFDHFDIVEAVVSELLDQDHSSVIPATQEDGSATNMEVGGLQQDQVSHLTNPTFSSTSSGGDRTQTTADLTRTSDV